MEINLNELAQSIHDNAKAKGFWNTLKTLEKLELKISNIALRTPGSAEDQDLECEAYNLLTQIKKDFEQFHRTTLIMLIVTELAEAVEGLRHGDDANHAEEMADALIRTLDYCKGYGIDIEKAVVEKMSRNAQRPPMHGKKF